MLKSFLDFGAYIETIDEEYELPDEDDFITASQKLQYAESKEVDMDFVKFSGILKQHLFIESDIRMEQ